ncbi:hypothetical protein J6590_061641 [Homalodisca vitripennis]|nr:hypothetical protein J6590_061641 [Homalodisca vitripennis]
MGCLGDSIRFVYNSSYTNLPNTWNTDTHRTTLTRPLKTLIGPNLTIAALNVDDPLVRILIQFPCLRVFVILGVSMAKRYKTSEFESELEIVQVQILSVTSAILSVPSTLYCTDSSP